MKALKIYGVNGLMEWQCEIVSGNVKFHFEFTDGVITAHGASPAKFKTDNPLFQNIIESSNYFKNGRIKLVKTIVLEEDAPKEDAPKEDVTKKVNVSDLEEAKQYLVDNYGISPLKLTGKRTIVSAARECNIEFVGI